MGIRDFFNRSEVQVTDEGKLDLHIDGSEPVVLPVTVQESLSIPTVYATTELIANVVAGLEIKLYRAEDGKVVEVDNDIRTTLLNDDTYNLMTGDELKKAITRDYLLDGNFYIYRNGVGAGTKSLHYLQPRDVSVLMGSDKIFRDAKIMISGVEIPISRFIIGTKNTIDGVQGIGVVYENDPILRQALDNLAYTSKTMGNGGIKRGVLQSAHRLSKEGIIELKTAWKKLYEKNNDCIVLNDGITYKELQQTGAEMQMVESKKSIDGDISKLFNVPVGMFDTTIPDDVWIAFVKMAVMPVLNAIEKALNKSLLSSDEKRAYYFAFDTKQLNKGDIEKRYKAYEIAIKNSIMTPSEVRYEEDLDYLEQVDFIKLNLGDVLLDKNSGDIYTPNTDKTAHTTGATEKGGEIDEIGIEK